MAIVTSSRSQEPDGDTVRNQSFSQVADEQRVGPPAGVIRPDARPAPVSGGRRSFSRPSRASTQRPPGNAESRPGQIRISGLEAQQGAARDLVTGSNANELTDEDFAPEDLLSAGIAGLSEEAVAQQGRGFSSVGFSIPGFIGPRVKVPNFGNQRTADAANRFFSAGANPAPESGNQRAADKDPTRARFQSQFFPSETLKDVGVGKRRATFTL